MKNDKSCSAFVPGPGFCRNGFTQNSACSGIGCPTCGNIKSIPECMLDEIRPHLVDDAGRMRFTTHQPAAHASDKGENDEA